MFIPGMPNFAPVMDLFSNLILIKLPRLYQHFKRLDLEPGMYASQRFMTIYAYNFPFKFVTRVWDLFFMQGWSIIFKVGIILLKILEPKLLESGFEQILVYIRDVHSSVDVKEILRMASEMTLPEQTLNEISMIFI